MSSRHSAAGAAGSPARHGKEDLEVPMSLFVDDKTRHWLYFSVPVPTTGVHANRATNQASVPVRSKIRDGRGNADLTLDEASFELVDCPTKLRTEDFYKLQEGDPDVTGQYYAEVKEMVTRKLGCDKVIVLHSQVRNASKAGTGGVNGYAGHSPHTDDSAVTGDAAAMQHLAIEGDETRYQRYLYVNLWRNIDDEGPIENDHLAVLDERSTAKPDDYITRDVFGPGYSVVGYNLNARHKDHHRWHYFSNMQKDEGLLFKQMDSDFTLTGRVCFHMSINDESKKTYRPRQSIETRMFCYWKQAPSGVDSMPTRDNTFPEMMKNPMAEGAKVHPGGGLQLPSLSQLKTLLLLKATTFLTWMGWAGPHASSYKSTFAGVIDALPTWPAEAHSWAAGKMQEGSTWEEAAATLIRALVADSGSHFGTKDLPQEMKDEICEAILADAACRLAMEKRLKPLRK